MWLTLAAMRNGIAILMASLAIILLGATSLGRMPIDLFPNINYPSLRIGTIYKGASAQDVERTVTYPIEKAVSAVANVRYVKSRSRQGFSVVTVQFSWGADVDAGLTEVMQRIQAILSTLPVGVQQPFILKFDLSNIPVCILTVAGGGLDERALYDLAYNTIELQIEDIVVRRTGTTPIRLRDVGRVEDWAETQVSIVRVNGARAVYLRVNKQPGA